MKKQKALLKARAEKPIMSKPKAAAILSIVSAVFVALTVVGIILVYQYFGDPAYVREMVGDHYVIAAIAFILICALQVVVAFIPGEVVEVAVGYVFGAWWGSVIALTGIVLGSVTTIFLVRKFGRRFVYTFYPKEKMDKLPILNNPRKRNFLTLVLFLIPGTPKDMLTYAVGLTDMSIPLYIALTTAARFPSVISSTLAGGAMGDKNYTVAIVAFAVTAAVSLTGVLIYNHIQKKHEQQGNEEVK